MAPAKKRGRGVGGTEYISLDGLRVDGRRPGEVRKVRAKCGALENADGSASFALGNTRVLATVYGPRDIVGASSRTAESLSVQAEYHVAGFAGAGRGGRRGRRSIEGAEVLRRVFEGVVAGRGGGGKEVCLTVEVLQDDGGSLMAAVNAASLALVDAGVPLRDVAVGCAVGWVDGVFCVDLCGAERGAGAEVSVVTLGHAKSVVEIGLEGKLEGGAEAVEAALEVAGEGGRQVFHVLEFEMRKRTYSLLDSRGVVAF